MSNDMLDAVLSDRDYPCLGVQSAMRRGAVVHRSYEQIDLAGDQTLLATDLRDFSETPDETGAPRTFIAIFPAVEFEDEAAFEIGLWTLLRALHKLDDRQWPTSAVQDPDSPSFRYFFNGRPWFVVGLSPVHSRRSRRSEFTAFAFNPSDMFEKLRRDGRYERFARIVRARDIRYSGQGFDSAIENADLGDAPQYAGRDFNSSWRCPLPEAFQGPKQHTEMPAGLETSKERI